MAENELTVAGAETTALDDIHPADPLFLTNPENTKQLGELARTFSQSALIPKQFQGKPSDCFVGLCLAFTLRKDLVTLFSNLHIINGKPGLSAQLTMALADERGPFDAPMCYEEEGADGDFKDYRVRAVSSIDGKEVKGTWVSMKMARLEGWTKNKKYESMPQHMLRFRAATFMIREYAPGVLFGMTTRDELIDMKYAAAPEGADAATIEADDAPSGQDLSAIADLNKTIQADGAGEGLAPDADEATPPLSACPDANSKPGDGFFD